jgi:hypothetical protein
VVTGARGGVSHLTGGGWHRALLIQQRLHSAGLQHLQKVIMVGANQAVARHRENVPFEVLRAEGVGALRAQLQGASSAIITVMPWANPPSYKR